MTADAELLNPSCPIPLTVQLGTILRQLIHPMQPGEALPSERMLTEKYRLSRVSVRTTMAKLETEGLVVRVPGKGTFVAGRKRRRAAVSEVSFLFRGDSRGFATSFFYPKIFAGCEETLRTASCGLSFSVGEAIADDAAMAAVVEGGVRGMIAVGEWSDDDLKRLQDLGLAVVLVDCRMTDRLLDWVVFDEVGGAQAIVNHLVGRGHRRVGLIDSTKPTARAVGYLTVLRPNEGERSFRYIRNLPAGASWAEGTYELACSLLDMEEPPTAIFAHNDLAIPGIIRAAEERGLVIGTDVDIAGCGNYEEILQAFSVPLLTLAVEPFEMGQVAARRMLSRLQGDTTRPTREVLPARLVHRKDGREVVVENNE